MAIELTTATTSQILGIRSALKIGTQGSLSSIDGTTLLNGELAVTTDEPRQMRLGDGSTPGGLFLGSPGYFRRKYIQTVTNNVQTNLFTFAVSAGQTYEYDVVVKVAGYTGSGQFSVSFTHPTVGPDEYDAAADGYNVCGIGEKNINGTLSQVYVIEGDTLIGAAAGIGLSALGYGRTKGTITFSAAGNFVVRYNTAVAITYIEAPLEVRFSRIK